MSHGKIRLLYQARVSEWASGQGLRVAYENVAFQPADGETYLQAYLLPAGTSTDTLAGDHRVYTGVFQVNVVTPADNGPTAAEDLVDAIAGLFPAYLRLSDGDFTVITLTPVEPGPGITVDNTYTVSASFQYRADTN